ncbi:MAG TPA: GAF domain-containing sensor histidine kinase [Terriglobales bacterium]|nr:GAF domain-containing sensor histidine kinase [Terriglobales bacterium]
MMFATLLSASIISRLRAVEHAVTKRHLDLLGTYASVLSDGEPSMIGQNTMDARSYNDDFRRRVRAVISDLCSRKAGLWYNSGRLWLLHGHKDRGEIFVPYTQASIPRGGNIQNEGFLERLRGSGILLRYPAGTAVEPVIDDVLRLPETAKGQAIVPLSVDDRIRGVLALYGSDDRQALFPQEKVFLDSIGKILANSIHHQRTRFASYARNRVSSLYSCASLEELFNKAAAALRDCLAAEACMIVLEPNPDTGEMVVVGDAGFRTSTVGRRYAKNGSQTALCASGTTPIRYDDVELHRGEFNPQLLAQLETSLPQKVRSWMAIPIGTQTPARGAIKVVNCNSRVGWFTAEDETLGRDLAVQLEAIIERRLHLDEIQAAKKDIVASLQRAEAAQKTAEAVARRRQEDIMIITHQLQGPLASVVGTLSELRYSASAKDWRPIQEGLDDIKEIIEDGIVLCYGIVTTFAKDAGRATSFSEDEIDAPRELELMAHRLRKTSARRDLSFEFNMQPGFPLIKMDRKVFTSVFYSLLHNAMKYADEHSAVVLECSQERSTARSALKVKTLGEPIEPSEAEKIFDKYERGGVVQRTGRHHSGVGLGLWVARQLVTDVGGTIRVELAPSMPRLSVFVVEV